jgi:4-carboxymuconolactone decarboxylase
MGRRLRKLELSELDHDQQALYQELMTGPRSRGPRPSGMTDEAGRLEGPFNAMLLSPVPGNALQALGAAVRYATRFPARSRELAILSVGYGWDSEFEVYAHEVIARAAGLTDEELAAVREGRPDDLSDPAERVLARTARALVTRSDLTDEEYQAARESLGEAGLFELTTLVGYYAAVALQLRVFRVPVPDPEDLYRAITRRSAAVPIRQVAEECGHVVYPAMHVISRSGRIGHDPDHYQDPDNPAEKLTDQRSSPYTAAYPPARAPASAMPQAFELPAIVASIRMHDARNTKDFTPCPANRTF